eukprot:scaffold16502_cov63-Phaeocystis_antarctica.AAC.3
MLLTLRSFGPVAILAPLRRTVGRQLLVPKLTVGQGVSPLLRCPINPSSAPKPAQTASPQ